MTMSAHGISHARLDRARWMVKELFGASLSTRKGRWAIVTTGAIRAERDAAFAEGRYVDFDVIEDMLFDLLTKRGRVPNWLASDYRTWRQGRDGYEVARAETGRLVPGYLDDPAIENRDECYRPRPRR